MAKFTIPRPLWQGFRIYLNLSDTDRQNFLQELNKSPVGAAS